MKKRLLPALLALAMVLGMLPLAALAATGTLQDGEVTVSAPDTTAEDYVADMWKDAVTAESGADGTVTITVDLNKLNANKDAFASKLTAGHSGIFHYNTSSGDADQTVTGAQLCMPIKIELTKSVTVASVKCERLDENGTNMDNDGTSPSAVCSGKTVLEYPVVAEVALKWDGSKPAWTDDSADAPFKFNESGSTGTKTDWSYKVTWTEGEGANTTEYTKTVKVHINKTPAPVAAEPEFTVAADDFEFGTKTPDKYQSGVELTKDETEPNTWNITGTLTYIEGWTEFNGTLESEQSGYYVGYFIPKMAGDTEVSKMVLSGHDANGDPEEKVYTKDTNPSLDQVFTDGSSNDYCGVVMHLGDGAKKLTSFSVKLAYGDAVEPTEYTFNCEGLTYEPRYTITEVAARLDAAAKEPKTAGADLPEATITGLKVTDGTTPSDVTDEAEIKKAATITTTWKKGGETVTTIDATGEYSYTITVDAVPNSGYKMGNDVTYALTADDVAQTAMTGTATFTVEADDPTPPAEKAVLTLEVVEDGAYTVDTDALTLGKFTYALNADTDTDTVVAGSANYMTNAKLKGHYLPVVVKGDAGTKFVYSLTTRGDTVTGKQVYTIQDDAGVLLAVSLDGEKQITFYVVNDDGSGSVTSANQIYTVSFMDVALLPEVKTDATVNDATKVEVSEGDALDKLIENTTESEEITGEDASVKVEVADDSKTLVFDGTAGSNDPTENKGHTVELPKTLAEAMGTSSGDAQANLKVDSGVGAVTIPSAALTDAGAKVTVSVKQAEGTSTSATTVQGDTLSESEKTTVIDAIKATTGVTVEAKKATENLIADDNTDLVLEIVLKGLDKDKTYTVLCVNGTEVTSFGEETPKADGTITIRTKHLTDWYPVEQTEQNKAVLAKVAADEGKVDEVTPAEDTVTIDDAKGGNVAVDNQKAATGDSVKITPTPSTGLSVGSVAVTDKDGGEVDVTDNGDGTYSFTMPAADKLPVSVKVEFTNNSLAVAVDPAGQAVMGLKSVKVEGMQSSLFYIVRITSNKTALDPNSVILVVENETSYSFNCKAGQYVQVFEFAQKSDLEGTPGDDGTYIVDALTLKDCTVNG